MRTTFISKGAATMSRSSYWEYGAQGPAPHWLQETLSRKRLQNSLRSAQLSVLAGQQEASVFQMRAELYLVWPWPHPRTPRGEERGHKARLGAQRRQLGHDMAAAYGGNQGQPGEPLPPLSHMPCTSEQKQVESHQVPWDVAGTVVLVCPRSFWKHSCP